MVLTEVGWEDGKWIELPVDGTIWHASVNMMMYPRVP
jgi:hypothetical protein